MLKIASRDVHDPAISYHPFINPLVMQTTYARHVLVFSGYVN
jgi:hypothetical protein